MVPNGPSPKHHGTSSVLSFNFSLFECSCSSCGTILQNKDHGFKPMLTVKNVPLEINQMHEINVLFYLFGLKAPHATQWICRKNCSISPERQKKAITNDNSKTPQHRQSCADVLEVIVASSQQVP